MIEYLIAPNEKIKKIWEKEYPHIKVYLSQKLPIKPAHSKTAFIGKEE